MDAPLLATKLFVPPARPGLVPRPRLLERLAEALDGSLVVVSAQAGSGKTTLLTQWLSQNKPPGGVAWVSLDRGDNDPVRFWDYFIAAVKTLQPAAGGEATAMLHSSEPFPAESVLTSLINDVAGFPSDFVVVLDDYHVINTEPIHAGISFLVDHVPPKMHLVIATRIEPALPLSRFRGRGVALEVGGEDLRFTVDEAADLLKGSGASLSTEQVNALHTRTEGWAVGLKMAALSIRGQHDIDRFIAGFTGSHRLVTDYLLEEVLKGQSPELRDFLLATSVLERLTAPLCDYVAGVHDSQTVLARLEQSNLFVVPLDESRRWYRYHQLLAELLRQQLQTGRTPSEVDRLHELASKWYAQAGLPDEAIRHALAAKDWEKSMALIFDQSEHRLKRGEWDTLLGWLRAVPDKVLCTHAKLYCRYANVLMARGQMEAAEPVLAYLETVCQGDAELQGEVAFFQAIAARRKGNVPRAIAMARRALELLPNDNLPMRARASFILGPIQLDKVQLEEAQALITEAHRKGWNLGDDSSGAGAASHLAYILWLRGRLREALAMDGYSIARLGETPLAAAPASSLCLVLYERNDLEGAATSARRALESSGTDGQPGARRRAHYCLVMRSLARGDSAGTAIEIERAGDAVERAGLSPYYRVLHAATRVIYAIRQNDLRAALEWGRELPAQPDDIPDVWFHHVPARLLIAQGEHETAAQQLKTLYEKANLAGAQGIVILVRVCQTLAASSPSEALTFLSDALRLGEPEGFIRTFVDEGRLLAPVLRQAVAAGVTPQYSARLLKIIEDEERQRRDPTGASSSPSAVLLSARELEILRLVADGLSNGQIAERLVISRGTAKTHVHNIFEKLGAKDRLDAVTKARDLHLI